MESRSGGSTAGAFFVSIQIPGEPDPSITDDEVMDEEIPSPDDEFSTAVADAAADGESGEPGASLRGTVVSVREDGYFVDIGRKSEAFLATIAAHDPGDADERLKPGEEVEVTVTGRSPDGYLNLSRIIAAKPKSWSQLEAAFESGAAISCTVKEVVKGGLAVDINGIRGFLPASRSGIRDNAAFEAHIGQEFRCRVIQLDVEDRNVIVDRRVLLDEEREQQRHEALAGLRPGMVVRGTVRTIRDFGAFVDLGGVDGLLHVSDLAWWKVKDVAEVLKEGDAIDVKMLKVEEGGKRISVGLKQLTPDPWTTIGDRIQAGDRITGKVTRLKDFGAFVEIEPGVEGLVHVSEMSWSRKVRHPKDIVNEGDVVDVAVLEVKLAERRISLGLKQALGDPWERAEAQFAPGAVVEGTVRNLAKFGAFVEVAEGVEGLLHISDITSEKRLGHPNEVLKLGQRVKAAVLEIDRAKRRLKLGMKQLEPDSRDEVIAELKTGDSVTGRVVRVSGEQAVVELGEGIEAVCALEAARAEPEKPAPAQDFSSLTAQLTAAWKSGTAGRTPSSGSPSRVKPGEVHAFKVARLDPKNRTIELTLADA
jgi:small subunit ribosomal protein S1